MNHANKKSKIYTVYCISQTCIIKSRVELKKRNFLSFIAQQKIIFLHSMAFKRHLINFRFV